MADVFDRMDGLLKQGTSYMNVELIYIDLEAAKRVQVAAVLSFCAVGAIALFHRLLGIPLEFAALISFATPAYWLHERFVRGRERRRRLVGYLWAVYSMDRWAMQEEDFFFGSGLTDDSFDALRRALHSAQLNFGGPKGQAIAAPGRGVVSQSHPSPLPPGMPGVPHDPNVNSYPLNPEGK